MIALLVFAATLLVAVFLSEMARRSVLSTAVLFLFTGFIAGTGALEWIALGLSVLAIASLTHANEFWAALFAGLARTDLAAILLVVIRPRA